MTMTTHERLISALTQYDEKQSHRKGHNPSALALYFEALDRAEAEAAELKGDFAWSDRLVAALKRNFCDRVLTAVLRAV